MKPKTNNRVEGKKKLKDSSASFSWQSDWRNFRHWPTGALFVVLVFVLAGGYLIGMNHRYVEAVVGPMFGFKVSTDQIDLSSVEQTYQTLKSTYDGKLDDQALIDGANKGLVEAVGDKWTVYLTKQDSTNFNNDLTGNIGGGIGVEIGIRNNRTTAVRILDNNPGADAGLKVGDVIDKVDGKSTDGQAVDQVASAIRGSVGSTVKIDVLRAGKPISFTITRATVNNPSVYSSIVSGDIGVMTITRFDDQTAALARAQAADFRNAGVRGVILDLRDNGGGYIDAARVVASLWLNNKVVVIEKTGGVTTDTLKSDSNPILGGIKTVVLVNGNSASAAEIVAGALKDNGAATLIGTQTYGKGSVQSLINLPGGAELKVTTARWYTPDGINITDKGITPDKIVNMTAQDANNGADPQEDAAMLAFGIVVN